MSIVLVRHGETEWSASGKHTGVSDVPLIEAGRRVAERLRDRLAGRQFALVLCSPRERARVTAGLAGFDDLEFDDDLVEVDYGDYEGLTTPEIRAERPGWSIWEHGAPGGETVDDAGRRADRVIERALAADGDVARVRARTPAAHPGRPLGRRSPPRSAASCCSRPARCPSSTSNASGARSRCGTTRRTIRDPDAAAARRADRAGPSGRARCRARPMGGVGGRARRPVGARRLRLLDLLRRPHGRGGRARRPRREPVRRGGRLGGRTRPTRPRLRDRASARRRSASRST